MIFPTHHGEGVKSIENEIFYTTPEMAKKLALLDLNKEEFANKVVSMTTPRPMNYSIIIKVNKGTIQLLKNKYQIWRWGQTDAVYNHLKN